MTHRIVVWTLAVGMCVAVVLLEPAAAQAPAGTRAAVAKPTPPAKTWTARTPDGQPDLQGFWNSTSFTQMERPKNVTKAFYTREEALEIQRRAAELESGETAPLASIRTEGSITGPGQGQVQGPQPKNVDDVHYDFTEFGLDRSQAGAALNLRTSLVTDPPDGRIPPMTAEGQRRVAERLEARKRMGRPHDAVQNLPLSERCIIMTRPGPPMLPQVYNNNYQIVQTPGYVLILAEMIHDARIIPLRGLAPLPSNARQWMGSSRGHWEGNTLVVETTNLTDKTAFQGSSENMRVIERFTRLDEDTLLYQFTIDDPATWARPWSAELPMKKTIGPLFEHACHEGNYGLYNTLAGARAEEKRAAEEAAKKTPK